MNDALKIIAAQADAVLAAGQIGNKNVPSPCVAVCRMDPATGWCEGCLRTLVEIAAWSQLPEGDKRAVWARLGQRARGTAGNSA